MILSIATAVGKINKTDRLTRPQSTSIKMTDREEKRGDCVQDLKKERSQCSFIKEEVTYLMDGGKDKTLKRKKIGKNNNNVLARPD